MNRVFYPCGVRVVCGASAVGHEEKRGPLGPLFDYHDDSDRFGADTWEKAEGELSALALQFLFNRAGRQAKDIDLLFAGDLQNQCVASAHGMLPFGIPHIGLYGACSTATEGLVLASLVLANHAVHRCAVVTSSHNCAAERQFRLPLEYGGQRTPTAQWTATAAGAFLLEKEKSLQGKKPAAGVEAVMAGKMVDSGIKDAANMGAAMAPAAADSILSFFAERKKGPKDYDAVVTGDLGYEGSRRLLSLLAENGLDLREKHRDCGCMLYDPEKQDVHAGASGCGCSAAVLAAYFLPALHEGRMKKILFLSTGALMSPSSVEQGESIFGIAPAIELSSVAE